MQATALMHTQLQQVTAAGMRVASQSLPM
jgi:hypothetical protein